MEANIKTDTRNYINTMKTITMIECIDARIVAYITDTGERITPEELRTAIQSGETFENTDVMTKQTIPIELVEGELISLNRKARNNLLFLPIHIPTLNKE